MAMIACDSDGYYHPTTEDEISELVMNAAQEGLLVRVRGSGHSVSAAIHTGDFEKPPVNDNHINIYLDKMIDVAFHDEEMQVTVQAGCHLGYDPSDPTRTSTRQNSLFYQLDQKGWALPNTGGIIHQTVAGFISTGSSGGSLQHAVGEQIVAFRLVDGTGNVHEFRRNVDEEFDAVGVSIGLLGIITAVRFQCVPKYYITGQESVVKLAECSIDLFGSGEATGRPSLETFLKETEYARLLWWPQKEVNKIAVWQARRIENPTFPFEAKPYRQFPTILGSQRLAQILAYILFNVFGRLNPPEPSTAIGKWVNRRILKPLLPFTMNRFVQSDGKHGPQEFRDVWWQGLPMDNLADDRLIPTTFTEIWIPLEQSKQVMITLRDHYDKNGISATGTYACEIYTTKQNNFWLSPAYHRDVIKIDIFWFKDYRGKPEYDFYPQFWELLRDFDCRFHWGKHLPIDHEYLRRQYPRWDDFLKLTKEMDPHQLFLTDYWRKRLGIQ